ncbi:f-box domain cyclin-like protein [Diplodia corticola]|uniref:F-box domain cyclin-like protein n=1 Tax=Diplodia corticola TaxID=236234 RepID=A0A1J9RKC8_9PEZI|nr:f-box domain cyclin-like protein [Diplodia corticola]OJD40434.1 f-box domain cyclin-like protein [Diplodia corticola]
MEKRISRSNLKRRPDSPCPKSQSKRGKPGDTQETQAEDKTSINDLPDELIEELFKLSNICYPEHLPIDKTRQMRKTRTLWSICLVSKRFCRIAEPLLYSWYADYDSLSRRHFLRRIFQSPDHAARVRQMVVRLEDNIYAVQPHDCGDFADIFAAAAEVDDILSKERWLVDLARGRYESEAALLLARTPNVEELKFEIDKSFGTFYGWTHRLARWIVQTPPAEGHVSPLSKLRSLVMVTEGYFQMLAVQDFLGIPSLRNLELWTPEASDEDASDWPQAISNVETLTIGPCVVGDEFIKGLMASCRALKRFNYAIGRNLLNQRQWKCEAIDMDRLYEALLQHRDCLETLDIEGDRSQHVLTEKFRLNCFGRLKSLTVSFASFIALGGSRWAPLEALPSSIETLRLNCFKEHWLTLSAFLSDLVENYREEFPRLKLLELLVDDTAFHFMHDKLDFLPSRLIWAGIELRLDERPRGENFLYMLPELSAPGTCSVTSSLMPDDLSKPRKADRGVRSWKMAFPERIDASEQP